MTFICIGKKELPSAEELAEKFLKRKEFCTDHMNTSLLFVFFAQHFTHEFFKTIYGNPAFTWADMEWMFLKFMVKELMI